MTPNDVILTSMGCYNVIFLSVSLINLSKYYPCRDFPRPDLGPVIGPFPIEETGEFSQFSAEKIPKMDENPNFTLAETYNKIAMWKTFLSEGK